MNRMVTSYKSVHNETYWEEISPFINNTNNNRILDIGCGPGLLLQDMFNRFKFKHLIGLDLSPIMLEKAKEILESTLDHGHFTLIEQHMQENPILPPDLDLIVSSRVLRSFDNLDEVMSNIKDSLNSDGKLIILDWIYAPINSYDKWFSQREGFEDLSKAEIIRYHRNFARYTIQDWYFILEAFDFNPVHSFQPGDTFCCIVATHK